MVFNKLIEYRHFKPKRSQDLALMVGLEVKSQPKGNVGLVVGFEWTYSKLLKNWHTLMRMMASLVKFGRMVT